MMKALAFKAALDVHYDEDKQTSWVAALAFLDWSEGSPSKTWVRQNVVAAPYQSGQFYLRELPCLVPLLEEIRRDLPLGVVIVDAHVDLGPERPGLGRHLFNAMGREIKVVGVAKNPFRGSPSLPLCRGRSRRPLWVSSSGSAEDARTSIATMHGSYRLPTLLRLVDQIARRSHELSHHAACAGRVEGNP